MTFNQELKLQALDWYEIIYDLGTCAGSENHVFVSSRRKEIDIAAAICQTCPVKIECLNYSFATEEIAGTWGGVSANDRAALILTARRGVGESAQQRNWTQSAWAQIGIIIGEIADGTAAHSLIVRANKEKVSA